MGTWKQSLTGTRKRSRNLQSIQQLHTYSAYHACLPPTWMPNIAESRGCVSWLLGKFECPAVRTWKSAYQGAFPHLTILQLHTYFACRACLQPTCMPDIRYS